MAGIYIHIPFCKRACHYCDFHFSTSLRYKDDLLNAIRHELALQKNYLNGELVETIYFGGGTPSLLTDGEINNIIDTIGKLHSVATNAEITLEANPDDLDKMRLNDLRNTPVNRLSVGVQSFFDDDLLWMNRVHNSNEAESSIMRAQDTGFENITADLIYGYPLLTDDKWKNNINKMMQLLVPHLSAYSMTVEPQTALAIFIKQKKQPPMNEQQSAGQFNILCAITDEHGFEHYEISNFCKPGHYSRHNTNYWRGTPYLGVGPSAHSFNGVSRQWNVANNGRYIAAIGQQHIDAETEVLTEANRLNEYIMTSLRTIWGLDVDKLEAIASGSTASLMEHIPALIAKNWIIQKDKKIFLTQAGKLYADHIAAELFF